MQDTLPRKRSFVYTEQVNVRIEPSLKADIRFLNGHGIDIGHLLRPVIREAIEKAKLRLPEKAS